MSVMIEKYERWFMYGTAIMLALFFGAIVLSVTESNAHLQTDNGIVDSNALRDTPPFDEPGVVQTGPNSYTAVVISQAWQFTPSEIRVPAGAEVTFVVASQDVIHGFMIPQTRVNGMVIPGRITELTQTFDEPGEHTIICHEFCGIGHNRMYGKVVVEG